jgi:hypothetical protein
VIELCLGEWRYADIPTAMFGVTDIALLISSARLSMKSCTTSYVIGHRNMAAETFAFLGSVGKIDMAGQAF